MRKIFLMTLLITLSCHVCYAEWTMFRSDTSNSGRAEEYLQTPLSVKWECHLGGKIVSSPVVFNNKVYIGNRDGKVYAIDKTNGKVVWEFNARDWVDSTCSVTEDAVYFSCRGGALYSLNPENGELIWKYGTYGTDSASPLVIDGKVFCGSGFENKFVYSLDAKLGVLMWKTDTQQMVYSSPAISGSKLYVGSDDGYVYCLDKNSGSIKWKYNTGGGIYYASPAVANGRVYIAPGNFNWSVFALDAQSGNLIWKYEVEDKKSTPTYVSSVGIGKNEIFFVSGYEQQYLYCINSSGGSLKWKAPLGAALRYGFSSSPCVLEDIVFVCSSNGALKAFEISTGNLVWEEKIGRGILASPAIDNDVLYIATFEGVLYALE
ncbi:MAG: PQQ-binding-like beta-propeller repeat protein [Candidatus Omnitrophota bacterium]